MYFLTTKNFKEGNYQNLNYPLTKKITIVKFYAPWCGHCKTSQPEYEKLDNAAGSDFNIAMFDCTVPENEKFSEELDSQSSHGYRINGFPTHVIFINGIYYGMYEGRRDSKSMLNHLLQLKTTHL